MWNYVPSKLRESQLWEFRDSHLGVLGQKAIWMWPPWRASKYTIKGKVMASPKSRPWWVLWVQGYLWLILTPKVLQLCTNHLVLVLCRFVWVIEAYQFSLVPSRSSSTFLYPSKVMRAKEWPQLLVLSFFSVWDSHLSPSRSWEHVSRNLVLSVATISNQ
jgi:hypothetical protein